MSLKTVTIGSTVQQKKVPTAVVVANPAFGVVGSVVKMDGRGSSDPDGNDLIYTWSFLSTPIGSKVGSEGFRSLDEDNSLVSFSPDVVGEYIIGLTVNNGVFDSAQVSSEVSIRAIMVPHGRGIVPDGKFIWSYIRDVWKNVEDREWFETFWSALIQIIGGELLKLYQVDFNKSIRDIQDRFQRRWLKYEPELDIDTTNVTFFLGGQTAGTNASSERLGLQGKGIILSSNEFIVTDGTVLPGVNGDDLTILFSQGLSNIGSYVMTGNNVDRSGYKTLDAFPDPTADRIATDIPFFFTFQSTTWSLNPVAARDYALAFSEHSPTLDQLTTIFNETSSSSGLNDLHVGDVIVYKSGPNAGHYKILSKSGSFVTVDHAPPSFSDITSSATYKADLYHPVVYSVTQPDEATADTFSLPYNPNDPNDLSTVAPGRVVVVGGQTYTITRASIDNNQSVPRTVIATDGDIPTDRTGLIWRLPNTIVSKTQNFAALGVSPGDLLYIEIQDAAQTSSSQIVAQVVGVDGFRLGFVLTDEMTTPGVVPTVPNKTFIQISQDLGINTVTVNPDGTLTFSGEALELYQAINTLLFHRTYWNIELDPTSSFVVGDRTFNIKPITIIRNRMIPVDDTVLSIPLLQNYIANPQFSQHDGKTFVVRNGVEYESQTPVALIENNDFIIDSEVAYAGPMVFDSGSAVIESDDADFIDRNIAPGDSFIIDAPITLAGTYIIRSVLDRNKIELQRAVPSYVLGDPVTAQVRMVRSRTGHFLRFIPGLFTAKSPAPNRLWAEVSFFDNGDNIEANFGILVGLTREQLEAVSTTVSYRQAVSGLMYAFTQGSAVDKVRLGTQILLGLPFAEHKGIIRSIENDYRLGPDGQTPILGRILIEDIDGNGNPQGIQRVYTYPIDLISALAGLETNPTTGKTYVVGDTVESFAPLCKGVEVNDYITKPLDSTSSGKKMLQQFHSIDVRANDNIFGPAEFDLISGFLKKITPSYIAFTITTLSEYEDDVTIDDHLILGVSGVVVDNASFSIPPALMFDSRNLSSVPQAFWEEGFYGVRRSGRNLVCTDRTNQVQIPTGGILNHLSNESFESPLTRPGDVLYIMSGPNTGRYPISSITDDQNMVITGTLVGDVNARYAILRPVQALIRNGSATTVSTSSVITVESGLLTDGVSVGDWLLMNGQRFKILRVGPCPAFTDPWGTIPGDVALLTGQLELDRQVGFSGSYPYRIYRVPLVSAPYTETVNVTGNGTNTITNDNHDLWMLLEPGDEIQLQNASLDRYIVLDPVNGYVTPTMPIGTTQAKLCKKNHRGTTPAWDHMAFDPSEQMDIELSHPAADATTTLTGTVSFGSLTNPAASGIMPGDRLQLVGVSGDATVDVGYGAGVYPIVQVTSTNVKLSVNLTTATTYAWKIIRRRT